MSRGKKLLASYIFGALVSGTVMTLNYPQCRAVSSQPFVAAAVIVGATAVWPFYAFGHFLTTPRRDPGDRLYCPY